MYRDVAMGYQFRTAMFHLCLAELDPAPAHAELAQALVQWLRGELRRIVALQPPLIFQRVARHNARNWRRLSALKTCLLAREDALA